MDKKIVVDREKLNHYKLKLTTLSPVHIGTGEVYQPTNFVIDDKKLYQFDEVLFYKSLNSADRKEFDRKLQNYMQIIDFYKSKKTEAKKISDFTCSASGRVQKQYDKQTNKDGSKNQNQLEIQTTFKNPNTHRAVIPGSSLKGMLETALKIYVKPPRPSNEKRQNLIVSDILLLDGDVEIGYADRRHRNPHKESKGGITQIIEVIRPNSSFILSIDSDISFEDLQSAMKNYHTKRGNSRYEETKTSFVARIGKNVGMDYVVEVDDVSSLKNKDRKPLATHFVYSSDSLKDEQFGWIKIELISEDEYQESLRNIENQEKAYHRSVKERQKEVKEQIKKARDEAKALALKKQQEEEAQKKAEAEAKAKREAELAAMDPLDKLIDNYDNDVAKVINAMKDGLIENFESIKVELAKKLKVILQKSPKTWEKAKQKALKRKEYIESLLE